MDYTCITDFNFIVVMLIWQERLRKVREKLEKWKGNEENN